MRVVLYHCYVDRRRNLPSRQCSRCHRLRRTSSRSCSHHRIGYYHLHRLRRDHVSHCRTSGTGSPRYKYRRGPSYRHHMLRQCPGNRYHTTHRTGNQSYSHLLKSCSHHRKLPCPPCDCCRNPASHCSRSYNIRCRGCRHRRSARRLRDQRCRRRSRHQCTRPGALRRSSPEGSGYPIRRTALSRCHRRTECLPRPWRGWMTGRSGGHICFDSS
jgi:hypothetical protein